jgi:hypothetical protein
MVIDTGRFASRGAVVALAVASRYAFGSGNRSTSSKYTSKDVLEHQRLALQSTAV